MNAYEGVYSTQCPFPRSTNVSGCTITASKYGINWEMNVGAMSMIAASNNITVHGNKFGACIRLAELGQYANYQINDNDIYAVEMWSGIIATSVIKPVITYNRVYQNTLGNMPTSEGITLYSCDGALLACNHIVANYGYNTTGIVNWMSNSCTIKCNNTNNQEHGFFYGGTCANTNMLDNTMINNFESLHLNNQAAIGIQKHNGNKFINYALPFGAVNDNTGNEGLSKFDINTLVGTSYHPYLNPINTANNWFFYDQFGSPYSCANNLVCKAAIANNDPDALEKSIAKDSATTSSYIVETKNINKKYLFERLSTDSALKASATIYQQFYNSTNNASIGKLYEVANDLKLSLAYSFNALQNLILIDSLIKSKSDSIIFIDSANTINPIYNYDIIRTQLLNQITTLLLAQETIINQQLQYTGIAQDAAQQKNSTVVTNEIPESNEKIVNAAKFDYYEQNKIAIQNNFAQIYGVASQCPFAGGKSVFEARVLLRLITDTIIYEDDAVCLIQGIYRMHNNTESEKTDLVVKPNPAQNVIEISIGSSQQGVCNYEFYSALGSTCLVGQFNCENKKNIIDISMLSNGSYTLKVLLENRTPMFIKIIVLR
nr:T9SS type A sorting domain-containing protein [Bacteroidota bacterium]